MNGVGFYSGRIDCKAETAEYIDLFEFKRDVLYGYISFTRCYKERFQIVLKAFFSFVLIFTKFLSILTSNPIAFNEI